MTLYHVSEDPDIAQFTPREPTPHWDSLNPVVWAIDEEHLAHYLLPRDCPRVCGYTERHQRFMAIESRWFEHAFHQTLFLYHLEPGSFHCVDAVAGYFVSEQVCLPTHVEIEDKPLERIVNLGLELHVVTSLWPVQEQVVNSGQDFSCIRMRYAQPPVS